MSCCDGKEGEEGKKGVFGEQEDKEGEGVCEGEGRRKGRNVACVRRKGGRCVWEGEIQITEEVERREGEMGSNTFSYPAVGLQWLRGRVVCNFQRTIPVLFSSHAILVHSTESCSQSKEECLLSGCFK